MQMITENEPAMPFTAATENELLSGHLTGLSIRQHFAGLAMQGLLSHEGWTERMANEANSTFVKQVAQASVIAADALIEALNKPKQ